MLLHHVCASVVLLGKACMVDACMAMFCEAMGDVHDLRAMDPLA